MSLSLAASMGLLAAFSFGVRYNIGLILILLILAIVAYWAYQVWQDMSEDVEPATREELLGPLEQARAAGELDEEEYARIRRLVGEPGKSPIDSRRKSDQSPELDGATPDLADSTEDRPSPS